MHVTLTPLLPALQVLMTAFVVVGRDLFFDKDESRGILAFYSLVGLGLAASEVAMLLTGRQESAFNESIMLDNFALFFTLRFFLASAFAILSSIPYLLQIRLHGRELYG